MKARVLFQKLCSQRKGWDDILSEEEEKIYQKWLSEMQRMNYLSFPRMVGAIPRGDYDLSLHTFCDASGVGYCANVYVVISTIQAIQSRLLTAKCRLAPLKKLTIPKLELTSGRTGAKLVNTVQKSFRKWKISSVTMWMDSMTALYWIRNEGVWRPYVNNRVKEIHELVPEVPWRHCPTNVNSSDLGTRGADPEKLQNSKLWWKGPKFLVMSKDHWPKQPTELQPSAEARQEEKETLLLVKAEDIKANLSEIIDADKHRTWNRLLKTTPRVMRFTNNCRKKDIKLMEKNITPTESEEKFEIKTADLGVYCDENGLIRCKGRLQNSQLTHDEKHPILIPPRERITKLIIMEMHCRTGHGGVKRTLAEVRSEYWIIEGRQVVKSVIKDCLVCKLFSAMPLPAPETAQLPNIHSVRTRPFQHTGVDFAGPIYVKCGPIQRNHM